MRSKSQCGLWGMETATVHSLADSMSQPVEEHYIRHSGPMHEVQPHICVLPRGATHLDYCLEEMAATLDVEEQDYRVNCIGADGKFVAHEWNNYRRGPFPSFRSVRPAGSPQTPEPNP